VGRVVRNGIAITNRQVHACRETTLGESTMRITLALFALVVALVPVAAASGFAVGRIFDVKPDDRADFSNIARSAWQCLNRGSSVTCRGGDAFPYVDLTGRKRGGVTVVVHTLRDPQGGRLVRTYSNGYPVYTFTAF
jgi:hypothetical protein